MLLLAASAPLGRSGAPESSSAASLAALQPETTARNAADLRPRVIMSKDCSGSTFVVDWAKRFLKMHGIPVVFGIDNHGAEIFDSEMLGKKHNPFFAEDGNTSVAAALDKLIRTTQSHGFAPLIKSTESAQFSPEVRRVLRRYGATAAVALRANALDRVICQVKDCFMYGEGINRLLAAGMCPSYEDCARSLGYVINVTSGARTDLCFGRRKQSQAEQHLLRVHLNVGAASLAIRAQQLAKEEPPLQQARADFVPGAEPAPAAWFEQLSAFEWDPQAASGRSKRAWLALLTALGVSANATLVAQELSGGGDAPQSPNHHATVLSSATLGSYETPPPHGAILDNAEEVRHALEQSHDVAWMWRASSGWSGETAT